tara:strand:- start:218 stop:730 length:513 start_codon:yes stop_codon:yes gene_type:complete
MAGDLSSINAKNLYKGQVIPADIAWNYFITRKPEKFDTWLAEYGDEETAKAARISQVLLQVRDWLERERRQAELPPLVMNTAGGTLNVLTDDKASVYLNDQAFQGLRRHQRATTRLVNAVDESMLSPTAKREHQNRMNVHSFIAASSQGAQKQLRLLKRAGKQPPALDSN